MEVDDSGVILHTYNMDEEHINTIELSGNILAFKDADEDILHWVEGVSLTFIKISEPLPNAVTEVKVSFIEPFKTDLYISSRPTYYYPFVALNLSTENGYNTIQEAVDEAFPGDEEEPADAIAIEEGTHIVGHLVMQNGVSIYGGYPKGFGGHVSNPEADPSRDPQKYPTVIDGGADNSAIICKDITDSSTTIDGCIITNGKASYGGGIYCENSTLNITNNIIRSNIASEYGGGIYCCSNSSPRISHNTIINNTGRQGGAICCINSSPIIERNTISDNTATDDAGGGIMLRYPSNPGIDISHNTISNNNPHGIYCDTFGGAIYNNLISDNKKSSYYVSAGIVCYIGGAGAGVAPVIENNIIRDNESHGIMFKGNYYDTRITVENNIIHNNEYMGINCSNAILSVKNCTITENDVSGIGFSWTNPSRGPDTETNFEVLNCKINDHTRLEEGAVVGGAAISFSNSHPKIKGLVQNCNISENRLEGSTGIGGAAIMVSEGSLTVENCTISDNHVVFSGNNEKLGGGAICLNAKEGRSTADVSVTLKNCTLSDNTAIVSADENYNGGGAILARAKEGRLAKIFSLNMENCLLDNNTFDYQGNKSFNGGGAICVLGNTGNSCSMNMKNCTIVNNQAPGTTSGGEGIFACRMTQDCKNLILHNNGSDDFYSVGATHSWIETDGDRVGTGNIGPDESPDGTPVFVDASNDYHLQASSPCIDVGDEILECNDKENPDNPGHALYPSLGNLRNDMGVYGGPHALEIVGVDPSLADTSVIGASDDIAPIGP